MLIDSNIIIYAAKPDHKGLRRFIGQYAPAVSAVSFVEVLGYHKLEGNDRMYFEEFFKAAIVLHISSAVLEQAIKLRQLRKMTLGDSLIAATCLVHHRTLVTCNTDDFKWIAGLILVNPLSSE